MTLKDRGDIFDCKCEGRNPDCQTCSGKGYYYQLPDSKEPQKKIIRPPDPFPIIMKDSGEGKGKKSHIEKRLEKYNSHLGKKRKKQVKLKEHKNKKTGKAEEKLRNEIESLEKELKKRREFLDRELERDAKMLEREKQRNRKNFLKDMRGENNDEESSK